MNIKMNVNVKEGVSNSSEKQQQTILSYAVIRNQKLHLMEYQTSSIICQINRKDCTRIDGIITALTSLSSG